MTEPQEPVDLELRRLCAGLGRPTLSPAFGIGLRRRLAQERQRQRAARRRLHLMQGYWLTICAASLYILWSWMQAGEPVSRTQLVLLGAGLALLALPLLLLLRVLRLSLMDLVFGTIDGLQLPVRRPS